MRLSFNILLTKLWNKFSDTIYKWWNILSSARIIKNYYFRTTSSNEPSKKYLSTALKKFAWYLEFSLAASNTNWTHCYVIDMIYRNVDFLKFSFIYCNKMCWQLQNTAMKYSRLNRNFHHWLSSLLSSRREAGREPRYLSLDCCIRPILLAASLISVASEGTAGPANKQK